MQRDKKKNGKHHGWFDRAAFNVCLITPSCCQLHALCNNENYSGLVLCLFLFDFNTLYIRRSTFM